MFHQKNDRSRQDSNLRSQRESDFKSDALTTRPQLPLYTVWYQNSKSLIFLGILRQYFRSLIFVPFTKEWTKTPSVYFQPICNSMYILKKDIFDSAKDRTGDLLRVKQMWLPLHHRTIYSEEWTKTPIYGTLAGYEIEISKIIFLFRFLPNSVQFPIFAVDCGLSFLSYIWGGPGSIPGRCTLFIDLWNGRAQQVVCRIWIPF